MASIYDFSAQTIKGQERPLEDYRGKVLLVVNTASKCGFTPQYEGLEALYKTYAGKGLEILGFPCNQFGQQEKGDNQSIDSFCQLNYGVSFPMFAKIDVNGENAHPVFNYLKSEAPGVLGTKSIKWNFTKFLIDHNGRVIKRFAPLTPPEKIEQTIKVLVDVRNQDAKN